MSEHRIALEVNGEPVEATVESRRLLVDFLRYDLGLVGVHVGCEHGVCGTCTVLLDGRSARSCIAFAVEVDGSSITTVEGLAPHGTAEPAPGGVPGDARPAMRVLHAGDAASRDRVPAREPRPHAGRGARGDREQPVPLYRLPVHRRRAPRRRFSAPGRAGRRDAASARARTNDDDRGCTAPLDRQVDPEGRGSEVLARAAATTSTTLSVPGMLHAAMLRSPHAHARIVSIDAERARGLPGVAAVVTVPRGHGAVRPDAGLRPGSRAARVAVHGLRQGALRRRAGRRDRRVEPLRRRGRARSHRGRVRHRSSRVVDARERDGTDRSARARGTGAPTSRSTRRSATATSRRRSPTRRVVVRDHFYWGRTGGQPLETVGARRELRPGDRPDDDPLELGRASRTSCSCSRRR